MSEKMIVACPECQTRFVAPLEKFLPSGRKVRCAKCGHSWFHTVDGSASTPAPVSPPSLPDTKAVPEPAPSGESIMDRATRATSTAGLIERSDQKRTELNPEGGSTGSNAQSDGTSGVIAAGSAAAGVSAIAAGAGSASIGREDYSDGAPDAHPIERKPQKRSWFPRFLFYTVAAALIAGALGYFFKDEIAAKVPALDPPLTSWKQNVDAVVSNVIPPNRSLRIENVRYDLDESGEEPALLVTAEVVNDSNAMKDAPKLIVKLFDENDKVLNELTLSPEEIATEIPAEDRAPYFLRMPYPPETLQRVEVDFAK